MSKDFEQRDGGYMYDPQKDNVKDPKEGRSGELISPYYGVTLPPAINEEIRTWATVLDAIKDGIPKPYDSTVIVNKITKLERKENIDLSALKACCPPSADIREAKELKPFIFAILDRIVDISGIQQYVEKYTNG